MGKHSKYISISEFCEKNGLQFHKFAEEKKKAEQEAELNENVRGGVLFGGRLGKKKSRIRWLTEYGEG